MYGPPHRRTGDTIENNTWDDDLSTAAEIGFCIARTTISSRGVNNRPRPKKQEYQGGIGDSFKTDFLKARLNRRSENPVPHRAYAYEGDAVSWRFLHQHWIKHAMTEVAGDSLLGAGVCLSLPGPQSSS